MNTDLSMGGAINTTIISDTLSEPSSDDFDENELLGPAVTDDVTAQLAAAGKLCRMFI